jgi:hypothetical protein
MSIKQCRCKHKSQDKIHGKNKRVSNPTKKIPGQPQKYRCTVCGEIK